MPVGKYRVSKRKNGNSIHFRIYVGKNEKGTPQYESFGTDEKAAIRYARRLEAQEKSRRLNNLQKISPEEANDLRWAIETLALHGATIKEAVDWFIKTKNPERGDRTLSEAGKKYLDQQKIRLKGSTFKASRIRVQRLEKHLGDKLVNQITEEDLIQFLNAEGKYWSKITELHEKRFVIYFFKWLQKNGFVHRHGMTAAENIPLPRKEYKKNKLVKPEEVAEFLHYLCETAAGQNNEVKRKSLYGTIARNVMILFCCCRREEALKISWENINLDTKTIEVEAAAAKTSQRRLIKIPDNAFHWLVFCKEMKAELNPVENANDLPLKNMKKQAYWYKKYREEFTDKNKVPSFCKVVEVKMANGKVVNRIANQNIFRHSAITYHLEKFGNVFETANAAGNSEKIIRSSYREINRDPLAPDAFFEIYPPTVFKYSTDKSLSLDEAIVIYKRLKLMKALPESNKTKREMNKRLNAFTKTKQNKRDLAKRIDFDLSEPHVRKFGSPNPKPNKDTLY